MVSPSSSVESPPSSVVPPRRKRRRLRRGERRANLGLRWLAGVLGAGLGLLALWLAAQHPLSPFAAGSGVLLVLLLARYFWTLWPGWMLGLVPWLGLAPWSGWMLVEEFDLLVLASLAGGYLALSGPHRHQPPPPVPVWRRELRWRRLTVLMLAIAGASTLLALVHGIIDAEGLSMSLYQGYFDSGEPLRAAKSLLWLLLLMPLWQRVARRSPQTFAPSVQQGLLLALLGCCVGVLVEQLQQADGVRVAAAGFFWEMHVGGGALAGALALLLPFAALAALRGGRGLGFAYAVVLLLLGLYAVLGTASRALYLAVGLTLPLLVGLWVQQEKRRLRGERDPASSWLPGQVLPPDLPRSLPPRRALLPLGLLLLLGGWAAATLWPLGGYRSALPLAGALVALLAQPSPSAPGHRARMLSSLLGLLLALALLAPLVLLVQQVDRSAYVVYALCWAASTGLARLAWSGRRPWRSPLGDALRAGLWLATVGSVALIVLGWGGLTAVEPALLPLALLAAAWPLCQGGWYGEALQQLGWRLRVTGMGLALLVAVVAGQLAATAGWQAVRSDRSELAERIEHWRRTLVLLDGEGGWAFGAGAGRYAAVYAGNAPVADRPGSYAWQGGSRPHLLLSAGRHEQTDAALLRMTQRLRQGAPGLVLTLKARNEVDLKLHAEVCLKRPQGGGPCLGQTVSLRANPDGWREHRIELGGAGELGRGSLQFALAVASAGHQVLLTDLSLRGANGEELLRNGDFRSELRHWLPAVEGHADPWHARNAVLQLLFEQGVVGLLVGGGLVLLALGRLLIGPARDHPLAPALTAALLAFLVVGQFESLVDVPRLALLFFVCLMLGLGLRAPPPPPIPKPA